MIPTKIKNGSKIGFFTPSDPIFSRRVEFIFKGLDILSNWGFECEEITDKTILEWQKIRSPIEKAKEFHDKLEDPSIDIIMATWGGKNASDILPLLNYKEISHRRKPIIGHSDIAVLLNAITKKTNLVTYYGPNVLGKLNQTLEIGFPFLKKDNYAGCSIFQNSSEYKIFVVQKGVAKGRLFGGSLGTFTLGLSGTQYLPSEEDVIFFFESSSLNYFQIRQHFQNLRNTGFLSKVVGVVTGVTDKIENTGPFDNLLCEYFPNVPIVRSNIFGHGFYSNPSIPIGIEVHMDTTADICVIAA